MFSGLNTRGLEGVVSKVRDSAYVSGRGNIWVKKTCQQRETLTIAGFALDGQKWDGIYLGRRNDKDLIYAGKVDHGFDNKSAADLRKRLTPLIRKTQPYTKRIAHRGIWVEPQLLAEIEYRAKSAEGKVRHPFFLGLRELYSTDHHNIADGLAKLPKDYAGVPHDVPRLGPPLPGDLGRPIVTAESQSAAVGLDAEQQRVNQETEAARTSKVFVPTTAPVTPPRAPSEETATSTASSSDETFAQNGQDRKLLFVNAPVDRRTTAPDRLSRPASPFVVQAGAIIPAALMTGIRSDLPGQITAQVTEAIFDSPTGRAKLIPQGARLIGSYDSQVTFGQSRVLLVWTRLIMPNGRSIVLERQAGADGAGYSGLEDEVDNHWKELLGAAALSTLLAVGTEVNSGTDVNNTNSAIIQALRRGAGDSLNQTGQQVVRRNLNMKPTLTIRPGFPVRVIVNRDLVLEPYRG